MTRAITGKVTSRCYAAPMQDCDGGPVTGEHWLTEKLLTRIQKLDGGNELLKVSGLSWAEEGTRKATPEMLQSKILCQRHNTSLTSCDQAICDLFDALFAFHQDRPALVTIRGEDLERWCLKALAGGLASGSVGRVDGTRAKRYPAPRFLECLFYGDPLIEGCGFHIVHTGPEVERIDFAMTVNSYTIGEFGPTTGPGEPRDILGVTSQMLGLVFMTTIVRYESKVEKLTYRPAVLSLIPAA
jgi:hypothetical protein